MGTGEPSRISSANRIEFAQDLRSQNRVAGSPRAASSNAREAAYCRASAAIASTRMFASMMPGSRDIVVDIPAVEGADHAKTPNR